MSQYPAYGMMNPGPSTADPEALARVVRSHKAGDALAQMALTVTLMAAICAVAFVLTLDRAAAAGLAWNVAGSPDTPALAIGLMIASGVAAMAAAIFAGSRLQERRMARLRPVPVRIRRPF